MPFLGRLTAAAALSALALVSPAVAQTPATPATPSVTIGGVIQADYEAVTVADTTRDRAFFRRLMLTVQVVATKDWTGQLQIDVAPSVQGDRVVVRDAYLRYLGWTAQGLTVTIGNQKLPFSRAALISASRRGLIERGAPGERPYGTPGRALAVQIDGRHQDQHVQWAAALASALHGPDVLEIRLDGLPESRETWNEGVLGAGRVEWHPLGNTPRDQGDFNRGPLRVVVGAGAYVWQNDGDRNLFTTDGAATSTVFADADQAQGVENQRWAAWTRVLTRRFVAAHRRHHDRRRLHRWHLRRRRRRVSGHRRRERLYGGAGQTRDSGRLRYHRHRRPAGACLSPGDGGQLVREPAQAQVPVHASRDVQRPRHPRRARPHDDRAGPALFLRRQRTVTLHRHVREVGEHAVDAEVAELRELRVASPW